MAKNHKNHTTFSRDLGLFDASMIGIGAMIGAGIFVLTGLAAGEAGPASLLAFALNGLVALLTAFAYAELASTIPKAGGGYAFVHMAFPGAAGFVAGWMLWFAYTVACSLYAMGFAGYFWEFIRKYFPQITEAVYSVVNPNIALLGATSIIGVLFIWLNVRGAGVTGKAENVLTMSKIVILAIFIFFGIRQVSRAPGIAVASLRPFFPNGFGGVVIAMGLTFIAFEGYDLIATIAEEIKAPEKNIPKATFISLGVAAIFYLFILFVSLGAMSSGDTPAWQILGKFKETAVVRAAESFMPTIGVAMIVFGGLLSTMSALNATIMAASRVAFSMGRDLLLPEGMAKIHEKQRTPHIAIIVTGIIILGMALTLPIETVGSAASLIFLLIFALVNLSVIVLRRKYPEYKRGYHVPLYPYIPIAGFVLNIFLALYQFEFQPLAWYVTAGWIAVGLLLYYVVFEDKAKTLERKILPQAKIREIYKKQSTVIVALEKNDHVETLIDLAYPIAKERGATLLAVSVVEVPTQMPIHEGVRLKHHYHPLMERAKKAAAKRGIKIKSNLIVAHWVSDGLLSAVEQYNAEALIMSWKGYTDTRSHTFGKIIDRMVRLVTCDLLLLKIEDEHELRNCFLPTSGGPNAKLAADVLNAVAKEFEMSITTGYVVSEKTTPEQRQKGEKYMQNTLAQLTNFKSRQMKFIEAKSIPGGIAKTGRDFDLLVIGATKEPLLKKVLLGQIPGQVALYSPTSVLLVKKYEGVVKSLIKRILG